MHKIGFSKVGVQERVKNASKESTYLMAEVQIVSSFKCYNVNAQKFENLLHRFFHNARLLVDIYDENGNRISPKEWFNVPLPIIDKVVSLILSGEIVKYRYDMSNKCLLEK